MAGIRKARCEQRGAGDQREDRSDDVGELKSVEQGGTAHLRRPFLLHVGACRLALPELIHQSRRQKVI
jgi:hypothetical protein